MPAGCEFTCRNPRCDNFDTGFVILAPWPMGDIDEIIKSKKTKNKPDLEKSLKDFKKDGRSYACIPFPNDEKIQTKAYRIHRYSPDSRCVWEYDVVKKDDEELDVAISKADIPTECPKTGAKMLDYDNVLKQGILCPSCNVDLNQGRWFAKESE
jgi:hypothetical protein